MDRSTKDPTTEHPNETDDQEKKGISTAKMELVLDGLYNDPSSPAAFAGVTTLWKEARKNIKYLRKKDVQNYLEGHRTYTLMRPRRVRFPRAKTVAAGFMTDVQVDLADFQTLSRHNRGHRYLLVAIDVLSKRLFVVPLRNKRAEEMLEAFKKLIYQMPMAPHRIFSDKGTEFKNRLLKEFFEEQEIAKHEPVHSSVKASIAERAIRNVKQRLYRYFAQKETLNWVDVVQKIVDGINRSPSRAHGMRPIDINFQNAQQVWKRMYGKQDGSKRQRFHQDEFVRMSREKGQFEKGYLPNYGDEILEVDEVLKKVSPVRYKLRDDKGEKFKGSFYGQELARVRKDAETSYRIEKVYRKRRKPDGSTEILVKFIGYPEREWINESQLV
uniref:Integrase catalytic domain-containing protein n=1 Tax=Globodera rostochiensis TaxID=31243 RepID=A0A914HTU3_GLORO